MCLGTPGKIVSVDGYVANVDCWGEARRVHLQIVDEPVEPGDWVLCNLGYAMRKIPAEDVEETLALHRSLMTGAPLPL